MSFLVRPPMQQPNGGPDEIDGLLRRFFQGEMPEPWPDCPRPEEPAAHVVVPDRTAASWWELSQRFASRLSLALSLAVLLAGAWCLSGSFTGPAPDAGPGVTATRPLDIEVGPGVAGRNPSRFKVNENFVQPKDGPTKMNIEIIDVGPPSKR